MFEVFLLHFVIHYTTNRMFSRNGATNATFWANDYTTSSLVIRRFATVQFFLATAQ